MTPSSPPEQLLRTVIHATGDEVPPIDAEQIYQDQTTEAEPEPLLPAAHNPWLTRLITTALLIWLIVIWAQAVVWGWALNTLIGLILLAAGSGIFGGFLWLGWQARRARHKLDAITAIQAQFLKAKAPHAPQTGVLNLSRRIAQLLQKNPQQAALVQALSSVDESWTYTELAQQLEHSYGAQDRTAAKLIQREAIRTGIFIAASPYPLLDFLLVAWRNVAMVERVALIYHLKLSNPRALAFISNDFAQYRLYHRHRNRAGFGKPILAIERAVASGRARGARRGRCPVFRAHRPSSHALVPRCARNPAFGGPQHRQNGD